MLLSRLATRPHPLPLRGTAGRREAPDGSIPLYNGQPNTGVQRGNGGEKNSAMRGRGRGGIRADRTGRTRGGFPPMPDMRRYPHEPVRVYHLPIMMRGVSPRRHGRACPVARIAVAVAVAALLIVAAAAPPAPCAPANGAPVEGAALFERAFAELDLIRETKRRHLLEYLDRLRTLAGEVRDDPAMAAYFHIKNRFFRLREVAPPPPDALAEIDRLRANMRRHYITRYLAFYDILFVNRAGDVVSSIRRQADYHANLFRGELAGTALARQLRDGTLEAFIDFEYYAVSGEPSAFHAVPALRDGTHEGWFVLQCAINRINEILSDDADPDTTGEAFLVNRHEFMLTDSKYLADSSILRQHLPHDNIAAKFRERRGRKIVRDYRGKRALTSFETLAVGNTEWLLIAKIDEDEVITRAFRDGIARLTAPLFAALPAGETTPADGETGGATEDPATSLEVDMDESRRARPGERLRTHGVATCTAMLVTFPGRFAYLAHASDRDATYGGTGTDLLGRILRRIGNFDLPRAEMRRLQIYLVAPHAVSFPRALERLLEEGLLLSQIRFIHRAGDLSASIEHDCALDRTRVEWRDTRSGQIISRDDAAKVPSLDETVRPLLGIP